MSHPIALGLQWIYETLVADSTIGSLAPGGFYRGAAPDKDKDGTLVPSPFVVFNYQSGSFKTTMNGVRVLSRVLYQIKATGLGDADHASGVAAAAAQIDALFKERRNETTTGGLIDSCIGDAPIQYDEPAVAGVFWTHFGGLYELFIQQS